MDRSHKVYISSADFPIVLLYLFAKILSNSAHHRTLKNYRKIQPNLLFSYKLWIPFNSSVLLKLLNVAKITKVTFSQQM